MGQAAFTSVSAPSPKTQLTTPSLLCTALERVLGFVPTWAPTWEEVNTPHHSCPQGRDSQPPAMQEAPPAHRQAPQITVCVS